MKYKTFKDGIELSRLAMGNMRLPTKDNIPGGPIDYAKAEEMIDYAIKHGVNYYDTAYVYHNGESEKFLGNVMRKYPRTDYYLATKFFILASRDYKEVFEEQLRRLQTDYIDFYLIHGIFDHTAEEYISSGSIDYFLEQKKAGRIKYLGFSSHASTEILEKFASHHDWDFAQIQVNYYDWNYSTAQQEYEILTRHGIPIMVMEPVRGGKLATLSDSANTILKRELPESSIASWAMRWLMNLDNVQTVLSGMSTLEQVKDNIATFEEAEPLTENQSKILCKACEAFKNEMSAPCTSCRYCCDDCPQGLDIPKLLGIYNKYKLDGLRGVREILQALPEGQKPSDCIDCGSCLNHCPQGISTPVLLKELAAL